MDKKSLIGMVLIAVVLFGFMYYTNRGRQKEQQKQQAETEISTPASNPDNDILVELDNPDFQTSIANMVKQFGVNDGAGTFTLAADQAVLTTSTDSTRLGRVSGTVNIDTIAVDVAALFNSQDTTFLHQRAAAGRILQEMRDKRYRYQDFFDAVNDKPGEKVTISNNKMWLTFNTKGGKLECVSLSDNPRFMNENVEPPRPVEVVSDFGGNIYEFIIKMGDREISTSDLAFTPIVEDSTKVTMKLDLGNDAWMAFNYSITDDYIVRLDVTQHNMDQSAISPNVTEMGFRWTTMMERNEKARTYEERNSTVFYKLMDGSPKKLNAGKKSSDKLVGVKWVAFKNQFFSAVVIPRTMFKEAEMSSAPVDRKSEYGTEYVKDMALNASVEYSPKNEQPFSFDFYFGPNSYKGLKEVNQKLADEGEQNLKLQKLVPMGWGIFGWINRFAIVPLFNWLGLFIGSCGLVILVLTIIIKIILFPFTYKSYMSQANMRVLAPEIKEINEKYPGQENAMKRQQETMKLYNRAGASPFSGCLPMLLQMPILIALFSFFPSAIDLRGQSFLWAHNLAAPDYICTLPFSIPFYGDKVSLFCLLMTITNIIYTRLTMAANPSSEMNSMKWMTYLMPVMFLFFFNDYASGLTFYYFISLLITITQTYICRLIVNEEKVRRQMLDNANKPQKKKGFMARLEAMQKKQEAMMREQSKQRAKRKP